MNTEMESSRIHVFLSSPIKLFEMNYHGHNQNLNSIVPNVLRINKDVNVSVKENADLMGACVLHEFLQLKSSFHMPSE